MLPLVIALGLATLAVLNLAGNQVGRILTWIVQPLVLIGGGAIMAAQVFAVRVIESTFENSDDATLESINVQSVVDAALDAFPPWFLLNVYTRFVLATLGSLVVIVLLALPAANAYFRKYGR